MAYLNEGAEVGLPVVHPGQIISQLCNYTWSIVDKVLLFCVIKTQRAKLQGFKKIKLKLYDKNFYVS